MRKEDYYSLVQNIDGLVGFRINENFAPTFIDGAVEDITGYGKKEFLNGKVKWKELILPEDLPLVFENIQKMLSEPDSFTEMEYRIRRKNKEVRWVRQIIQILPADSGMQKLAQGFIRDITKRKALEIALKKIEEARMKEIHHRIKNNLQVISALLSLEAEKFNDEKILEAFRESQNRITSMALIHEELYKKDAIDKLDFAGYLHKLTAELFSSYSLGNDRIKLTLDLEQAHLGMNTAIPLGIIVNELISNALKHAFPDEKEGEVHINFHRVENYEKNHKIPGNPGTKKDCRNKKGSSFLLIIGDDGQGLPERINFENTDSFGLQLVSTLVDQIGGRIEIKRGNGTEFEIQFKEI
ncbi:sensor histidine kinase [Methanosarcina sp. Mfa9]|uniref:sensor histidine kinase n=1 Tax=Methanosarcina sp. Mfa9 TaxID=3439063 RepID=UPI003F83944C